MMSLLMNLAMVGVLVFLAFEYIPRSVRWMSWLLLAAIPTCILTRTIMLTRSDVISDASWADGIADNTGDTSYVPIVRVLSLVSTGLSLGLIFNHLLRRSVNAANFPLTHPVTAAVGFLCSRWLIAAYSDSGVITPALFYMPILVAGWWLAVLELGPAIMRRYWMFFAGLITVGSLVSLAINPTWARGGGFMMTAMGDPRLFGLMDHPSALFPVALTALCLAVIFPLGRLWQIVLGGSAVFCLLLANNITSFIALAFLVVYAVYRLHQNGRLAISVEHVFYALGALSIGALVWSVTADDLQLVNISGSRVASLSGRSDIWPAALRAIADSPIIGHGLEAFRARGFAADYGIIAAHAHSQYLDILVQGGVIHLLAFLWFAVAMVRYMAAMPEGPDRTMATSLFIIFLARGLSERPLDFNLLNGGVFFFLCLLSFLHSPPVATPPTGPSLPNGSRP